MSSNRTKLPPFKVKRIVSALSEVTDWGLLKSGVPKTWNLTQGEGINVYILDTAGATDHIDLEENFKGGANFSSSKTSEDVQGHSTHCAGIVAASKNGIGVVGVAPKANIFLIKVLGDDGSGSATGIGDGLKYCYETLGGKYPAHVVSMSLGAPQHLGRARLWIKKLYEANVPIVCAAGNTGRHGVSYPAKYPETIAVGAYDKNGNLARFSTRGEEVDFVAPGVDIYSTWLNSEYAKLSGTSMATPFVTGIIALMLAKHAKQEAETGKNDCKTISQIKEHLIKYSIDQGKLGRDTDWGYGIIDIEKLMNN